MPRGDKPTTTALALRDGWIYEDALPATVTKEQYDWWYKESLVLDGVRMGPPLTTDNPTQLEDKLEPLSDKELRAMEQWAGAWIDPSQSRESLIRGYEKTDNFLKQALAEIRRSRAPVVAPQEDARLIVDLQRELAYFYGQYHGRSSHREDVLRCTENECVRMRQLLHAGPSSPASSPVPPNALSRASKLCRSTIPGARVELIFQNLQDAQAVHKWLCNLNMSAATPTPVEQERREAVRLAESVMDVFGSPGISPQTWDRLVEVCAVAVAVSASSPSVREAAEVPCPFEPGSENYWPAASVAAPDDLIEAAKAARAWICRVSNQYVLGEDEPYEVLGDEDRCAWTLDDSNDGEFWETGCGEAFRFTDGGPTDNGFVFCYKCGKRISAAGYSDSDSAGEEGK